MKIAVLGGGISGLVAAYNLSLNTNAHVVLYEAAARAGGWIQTVQHENGAVFELGPNSMRCTGARGKQLLAFLYEIALEDEVKAITKKHSAASRRYLGLDGELYPLPYDLKSFIRHPHRNTFIKSFLKEPFVKGRYSATDESVYMFFERRFGTELAELISDPICRGILASDSRTLGVSAMFPDLVKTEYQHKSLIKGLLANYGKSPEHTDRSELGIKANKEEWKMLSFNRGMEQLPQALLNMLQDLPNVDVCLSTPVVDVTVTDPTVTVTPRDGVPCHFHHVVSALPAFSLASVLSASHHPDLIHHLRQINFVDVALVSLEFWDIDFDVPGFGCLIPSYENPEVLGIIFSSCLFPHLDSDRYKTVRFTLMLGGEWFERAFGPAQTANTDAIRGMALKAVRQYLKIEQTPSICDVDILEQCIPHYTIGHRNLAKHIFRLIAEQNLKLSLVGNSYFGAGVPDCILNAIEHTEPLVHLMKERYNAGNDTPETKNRSYNLKQS